MNTLKLNSRNRRAGKKEPIIQIPIRLDLGCGPNKKPTFTGVDAIQFPGVDIVSDLKGRWPWGDSTVEEAHSSHCMEHFTAMERVHFLNELYRVLKSGSKATIITPHWSSCRAYGDPTHQWPPVSEFLWYYLKRDWRMANAPHTDEKHLVNGFNCNFEVTWGYALDGPTSARNQEYQQMAMNYYKDCIQDMIATLTAVK